MKLINKIIDMLMTKCKSLVALLFWEDYTLSCSSAFEDLDSL